MTYTEDGLIEQPAIQLFSDLEWDTATSWSESFGELGSAEDHKHLGQIITYASGIDAKILIWLCREVTEEHRKAIDWLNEVTNADISFFACEIELWRIGNSLPAPRFHIIASPNDWSKSMKASNTSNGLLTETKKGHLAFWNGLKTYMEEHGTDLRLRSPRPQHWYTLAVGRSKFSISLTTNTQLKRVGCEIYIRGQNAKNAFHQLKKHCKQIETSLGYELDWKELPDGQDSRIGTYIDGDSTDPACWDKLHSTLKEFAENFYTIFSPLIKSLKI